MISREKNRTVALRKRGDDDLVTQVFAGGAYFSIIAAVRLPCDCSQSCKLGILRGFLLEDALRLPQILRQIRNAGEEHGIGGQAAEKIAAVPQAGQLDLGNGSSERGKLGVITVAIPAPGDVVVNRFRLQIGTGDHLIAGLKDLLLVFPLDVDLALNHGNARALGPGAYAKRGTGDGHAAIGGSHKQMTGATMRRLHDHAAVAEPDGSIAGALGSGQAGTLAQLHQRAVVQLEHSARILGRTDFDSIGQRLAGPERLDAGGGDLVKRAVDRLHDSRSGTAAVLVIRDPDGDAGRGYHNGGHRPAVMGTRRGALGRRHRDHTAFIHTAAGYALVQMILQQGCARRGQAAGAVIGNQRLKAGAIGDMASCASAGCGNAGRAGMQARPHAGGGGFDYGVVNGLVADVGHGLVKFRIHATPP